MYACVYFSLTQWSFGFHIASVIVVYVGVHFICLYSFFVRLFVCIMFVIDSLYIECNTNTACYIVSCIPHKQVITSMRHTCSQWSYISNLNAAVFVPVVAVAAASDDNDNVYF